MGESQLHNKGPKDFNPFQCLTKKDSNITPLNHTKPTSSDLEMKLTPLTEDMLMPTLNHLSRSQCTTHHLAKPTSNQKHHAPTHFEHPNSMQLPKWNMQTYPKVKYYSPFSTQRSPQCKCNPRNSWNKQQIELYHKANEKTTNLQGNPNGHWKCQSLPQPSFKHLARGQHQTPT